MVHQVRKDSLPLDLVCKQMKHENNRCSIDDLAKQSFLSNKQFERKFLERVGVYPKTYTRIIRFNRAFNLKNRYPSKTWSGIAVASGYHDHQHLVKEYKMFTGTTPRNFHIQEANAPENLLGLAKEIYHTRHQAGV
jgi:transcriptional regulator GlxA family with amidase domain